MEKNAAVQDMYDHDEILLLEEESFRLEKETSLSDTSLLEIETSLSDTSLSEIETSLFLFLLLMLEEDRHRGAG